MAKKTVVPAPKKGDMDTDRTISKMRAADILKRELPHLINDIAMLVRRPFRFIWDPSVETASTDCLAEIRVAPRPFLEGEREVGYGTAYHETGHIRFSPYGGSLMHEAQKRGGEVLCILVNIILDRKDDVLTAREAPGFADTLRKRLLVIRTMSRRERYKHVLGKRSLREQSMILRNFKPTDAYEDFFLAAKCGKSPRLRITHKAMKYVRIKNLIDASPEKLLWIAERVREILGEYPRKDAPNTKSQQMPQLPGNNSEQDKENGDKGGGNKKESDGTSKADKRKKAEKKFIELWTYAEQAVYGKKISKQTSIELEQAIKQYVGGLRTSGIKAVLQKLSTMGITYPGPISVGRTDAVPVRKVDQSAEFSAAYQNFLQEVQTQVAPMVKALRNISTPSEFEIYGRDEGDLDLTEVARIATNLGGYYSETVVERDIDAEIHLAIDCSGSMNGHKINQAKKIGVVFSEAVHALDPMCLGRIWSFNSEEICDYDRPGPSSGFVTLRGTHGNSDTHMLQVAGKSLLQSTKRRKILFVLCDDGPDDIEMVKKLSHQLAARGVIVIHLLVGVHGTPDIYPIELLYTSMEECLEEFGELLKTIISHLK